MAGDTRGLKSSNCCSEFIAEVVGVAAGEISGVKKS
jgi:hypothetical protein